MPVLQSSGGSVNLLMQDVPHWQTAPSFGNVRDMSPFPDFGCGHPSDAMVAHLGAQRGVQRVPSPKLTLFVRKAFLEPDLCAQAVALIEAQRRPSTIADPSGDAAFRTSETCDLAADDSTVIEIERRVRAFTGLAPAHGEPMQGQRYAVGQEFKGHTDYFEPDSAGFAQYCSVAGQRTWTVMVYLNTPEAGGATRFKAVDKIVQPETGKLLAWNNLRGDGTVNPATIHQGMKVRAGVKYVITKWFREKEWV